ncbi:MAG: hypothetical protein KatS3mg047_0778 [Bellilinea sp.]|nr:MAG: hypothetical protein KatS3mg047_0778 [Bellilinea sp.]
MVTIYFKSRKSQTSFSGLDEATPAFGKYLNNWNNNHPHKWQPATDVYETEDKIIILMEIAGIKEEDLAILLHQDTLIVQGIRRFSYESPRAIHQMEIPYGEFNIELHINIPVDDSQIEAVYEQGLLRIELPKARPKQIHIIKD